MAPAGFENIGVGTDGATSMSETVELAKRAEAGVSQFLAGGGIPFAQRRGARNVNCHSHKPNQNRPGHFESAYQTSGALGDGRSLAR